MLGVETTTASLWAGGLWERETAGMGEKRWLNWNYRRQEELVYHTINAKFDKANYPHSWVR